MGYSNLSSYLSHLLINSFQSQHIISFLYLSLFLASKDSGICIYFAFGKVPCITMTTKLHHHGNNTTMATNSITLQQYNHDNDLHYHGNTITMTIKQHHHGISVTMVTLLFLFSLHVEIRQDNPSYRPWGRSEPGATVCVWKARRN